MFSGMRTTIRLPDELYAEVRRRSADKGVTVTFFVEGALRAALVEHEGERGPFQVRPYPGTGTLPGVELTDSASLLEAMGG